MLKDLFLKARRIARGNVLGGDRDSTLPVLRSQKYLKGPATFMSMPHIAALSPRVIAAHLRSRDIEVKMSRIFYTWCACVSVLACGVVCSVYFYVKKYLNFSNRRRLVTKQIA